EAYNPITWDPSWLYRVDYYSPMVGAADFIVGVTEPPPAPHEEVLWYLGSFTAAPLTITLDKTIVTTGEPFNATVTYYNDTTSGWEPLDNATVHVGTVNYMTGSDGNAALSLSRAGSYTVYAEKEGFVRSLKRNVNVSLPCITVRIEGKNETVWYGEVIVGTSTIVDTANVSHYSDKPTALGALDAASKLGNFSYKVVDMGWGLMVTSIGGEVYNPVTWDPSWLYRVDYYSPMVGAADFIINVKEPPSPPHEEVLWYLGSFTAAPLTITLDKTIVTAGEPFNATVTYYNDTTSGWEPLDNATVYVGALNYTTGSDGNATLSLSSAGSYTVYAEKEGFVRSLKRNVCVSLPCITVRIEGKNETVWYGDVTVSNSTIVDTANVSHYFDKPTALGALDAASKLGNFSYEVEDMGWGLLVTSIGGEGYNPVTWDPSWLYRVDYYSPMVGAADFIINVKEPPSPPHEEVLWYLGSFTAAPLTITLDKTSVTAGEPFNATVTYYNDTTSGWKPRDNATVHVGPLNFTTSNNGNTTISVSSVGTYLVYAEKEGCVRSETKSITVTPEGGGGDGGDGISWWLDVSVSLPEGLFNKTAFNTNKIFTIEYQTALGALQTASEIKGFEYKLEEWDFGPFVYSIGDKQKYDEGATSGWMYRVNGEDPPNVGAHDYSVDVGDELIWYFSKNMDTTPSTASRALRIKIVQPSEGSGGKESISSPTPAPALTQVIEETQKIALIEAGSNASVTFDRTNVTRIIITANNTIRNAEVMIQPLGDAVFALNVSGVPYCYFNVTTTNLTDNDMANATIEFKVNRTWINASNVDEATITLSRYHDNHWDALPPTVKIGEDNTLLHFRAVTPGFSVFVITGERKTLPALVSSPSPTVTLPAPEATTEKTSAAAMTQMPASASMPQIMIPRQKEIVVAIVSITVLLIVLVAYYARRRGSE
ncbi:MAG TPA: PGF-pre-PGF domain-containing protein, partial [Desulfobacteria bacterium]|nr:PGF-pre-PGF domain-containing protein [Desulfobacteria bacterium]